MPFAELDIPSRLPVDYLSVSAVNLFRRCPTKYKRRYIDREYEAPTSALILGSAVGAAENIADHHVIDGDPRPATADVLDLYADEFDERVEREEIDWRSDKPGEVKDVGVAAVTAYEQTIVPTYTPVTVERQIDVSLQGVAWGFRGYLDVECEDGTIADRKVRKRKLSQSEADDDPQATGYLMARRAEGDASPAFVFQTMVKTKTPYAETVRTLRTERQLDQFVDLLYQTAAEIHWRLEHDMWGFAAPGAWWCSSGSCGYWRSCPGGGLR